MIESILSQIFTSQWQVFLIVSALLLASAEVGFHFGLRLHRAKDEARRGQVGGIQAALLGLLALLLSFTFSMSEARYEMRRALVLQEANAIGTTYLRAAFLPETRETSVENLLRRYVDARLAFHAAGEDEAKISAAEQQAAGIQRELWAHATAAAKENPTPITATFVSALNETIDLDATRLNALHSRVPDAVRLLVLVVAICGCVVSGSAAGASGKRNGFTDFLLPMLIAVVITLISDIDRPSSGLIRINQQPLLNLKQSLHTGQP